MRPGRTDDEFSIGDIDGDGDLDLLTFDYSGEKPLGWHENDGSESPQFFSHHVTSIFPWGMDNLIVDLDGDGDNDIVAAAKYTHERHAPFIYWFENSGHSEPHFTRHLLTSEIGMNWACKMASSDLDNDGDADLLIRTDNPWQLSWFENLASNPLSFQPHLLPAQDGYYPIDFMTRDFNGDKLQDIVVCYNNLFQIGVGKVIRFENHLTDPLPNWRSILMDQSVIEPHGVDVADLDLDGDLDTFVLGSSYDNGNHKIYYVETLNQSTDTYATGLFSEEIYRIAHIRVNDIDRDGDQDIMLQGSSNLLIIENTDFDPIRLISPRGQEQFDNPASVSISWKTDVLQAGPAIEIELLRRHQVVHHLGYDSAADGRNTREVRLPLLRAGEDYSIRITSTRNSQFYDESEPFRVGERLRPWHGR